VRRDFVQAITDSGGHWSARPMIRNGLAPGVDLDAPKISWETPGIYGIGADGRPKDAPAPAFPSAKAKSGGAR